MKYVTTIPFDDAPEPEIFADVYNILARNSFSSLKIITCVQSK
jgi:hypothetical protein